MVVDRQKLMLGGAAGVVLIFAVWTLWPASETPATGVPARTRSTPARAAKDASHGGPVHVKIDRLSTIRGEPGEQERNPFRFKPKPAPPPPKPVATPVTEAPRIAPPVPTGPPPPPPIPLKLIGLLTRENGVRWAVLSDGKSAPMYGKDGDIIDGRYAIVKIGTESIEMTYADGRGRQVIRLSGQ